MADAPIDPRVRRAMNNLADALNHILKPWGFCLLVFQFNDPAGTVNYISNAERTTVIPEIMRAMADRLETKPTIH